MEGISLKKAVIINFISKYSNIIMQLLISVILARLLSPKDYGIVAVVTVFTTFFSLIADMGFGPAIIQNKELKEKDINSIFSFTFYIACLIAIIFSIFSIPISLIYKNKVYISIGILLSISLFFSCLNIVPNALVNKNKEFKKLGERVVMTTIISGAITIITAILGLKYYSIVINSITNSIIMFIFNFKGSNIKFSFKFERESIDRIKNFSKYQFLFNVINYFSRNLDNLLIGKFMGSTSLGYYNKAYTLMLYPIQNLTNVISPLLHPIFSEFQNDKEKIYNSYMKIVKILSLIGILVGVYCFFASKEIVLIMFGIQWSNSAKYFKILSISLWFQMITSSTGGIFQATGNVNKLFKCGSITTGITILCILVSSSFRSIEIISLGVSIAYILHFFVAFKLLIVDIFNKKFFSLVSTLKNHIIIFIIVILGYKLIFNFTIENLFLSAIIKFAIILVLYIFSLVITKEYKSILSVIKKEKNENE